MTEKGVQKNEVTYGTMIDAYGRSSHLQKALTLLKTMSHGSSAGSDRVTANVNCYNAALLACQKTGSWETAVTLLGHMQKVGCTPNACSYSSAICACAKAELHEKAIEVFFQMQNLQVEPTEYTYNVAVASCYKAGMPELASKLLVELQASENLQPNSHIFSTSLTQAAR
eukprot:CAMPEP_0113939724 /NCGR_PEP_ID=MMETSP1339-20121228/6001_1 /TAXON_ID=94617 /ORGANISM="Fibrocapsa japonica" /LENGTH=169 /DNA_ID=CAMNT_0000943325 /DNA_START=42 /DNA_END=548 /DNA_ORIENTATION=+ /assembly_acc=CAM_ASM_000762